MVLGQPIEITPPKLVGMSLRLGGAMLVMPPEFGEPLCETVPWLWIRSALKKAGAALQYGNVALSLFAHAHACYSITGSDAAKTLVKHDGSEVVTREWRDWSITCVFCRDADRLSEEQTLKLFERAGALGIGLGREGSSWGRFMVEETSTQELRGGQQHNTTRKRDT